MWLIVYNS